MTFQLPNTSKLKLSFMSLTKLVFTAKLLYCENLNISNNTFGF